MNNKKVLPGRFPETRLLPFQIQRNSGKCHLILSTNEAAKIHTQKSLIESTNCEKLLGVKIDSKLSFDNHIKTICKKASNKLRALARITSCTTIEKKKVLINSFFIAH